MHNVSQEQAIDFMPLAAAETTRFWRDGRFDGMECLSATFLTHEYSPHAHETFSIGAIESGSQISTIQGATEQTGPGHLYLINPDEIHDGAPGGGGYRYRMIYPGVALLRDVLEDVTGRAFHGTPSFPRFLPHDPQMATAFQMAHRRMEMKAGALETDEGMYSVMAELFRRYGSTIILPLEKREKTAVHTTRDYLNDNFDTDIGLEELAKIAGLSRAHLIRAFRKEFHITPHAYLTDVRIRKAKKLLRTGEPLADIAALCGFADQAHFNRHFKARMGITPGQFRAA
ncbi:AraC family transcriptional regulator [Agrobacterium sp. rho-13.3]|uniref:AraC family transcriptional regulator n=1 Tax=Agrobacterium sp. rho-13.3 TaxID=3072980 RepID=UPI002A184393|nr:AraC family transcriptional regulator [Agrobacterium sp. rho-13.3]MDX8308924.1 AraC family transcriptional regulator [Agrobacterium sp. rho-13.3]